MTTRMVWVATVLAVVACKKDSGGGGGTGSGSGSGSAQVAPIATPPLGVESIKVIGYSYGPGQKDFERAQAAAKTSDWTTVAEATRAAIGKDEHHLDARRLLASALVQQNQAAEAVDHLVMAVSGDFLAFGRELEKDPNLTPLWTTPHGKAVKDLVAALDAQVGQTISKGVLVLGRRAAFRWPSTPGAQSATSRGELYAYDLATKRYVRLTHTNHSAAAYVVTPSGKEIAVVGFDKVEMPPAAQAKTQAPLLVRGWVQAFDAATWAPTSARAQLGGKAGKGRALAAAWGAGDQLIAMLIDPVGRWDLGAVKAWTVDRTTGKLAKTPAPTGGVARAVVTLDDAWIERGAAGITATWSSASGTTPPLTNKLTLASGKTVDVPESGQAAQWSLATSPGGKRVAMATWVDPCATTGETSPSLYAIESATGQLKHLLTGKSTFRSRWLDDDRLIYEDGTGALRVWDATTGREVQRITEKGGLALAALSAHNEPICKVAPMVIEPDTGGDEMPPEEGGDPPPPDEGPAKAP